MSHLLVAAAHKSSGKTTVSLGLCAALSRRGLAVQPFKKGPDYIDPMWLRLAAGRPCYNLDFHTMSPGEIRATFAHRSAGADISLIEANKGLYDGMDLLGSDSNAALAKLFSAPVVLVVDTRGMTRGVAPLLRGYRDFDPDVQIAGVILNQVGGARHEGKLREVIEHYADVPVLGSLARAPELGISERHIGLVPGNEHREPAALIERVATAMESQVDLDAIVELARGAPLVEGPTLETRPATHPALRIGVVRDSAFGFYYPDDLEALQGTGAELLFVDALRDAALPELDGLFIGGGFPETHMRELESNTSLRHDVRRAVEAGLPVYAECGGLMYLARRIDWKGTSARMAGAIPADVVMCERPQGRGYVRLRETPAIPWPQLGGAEAAQVVHGHEFHYSHLENLDSGVSFAYEVLRGKGVDGCHDGIVHRNVLASYAHLRDVEANHWAARFAAFVRRVKADGTANAAG